MARELRSLGGQARILPGAGGSRVAPLRRITLVATEDQYGRWVRRARARGDSLTGMILSLGQVLDSTRRRGPRTVLLAHGRRLVVGRGTLVMGVLNVTPDSFSDGGRFRDPGEAIQAGLRLVDEGADILDVGGESTRPGASPVPPGVELRRVLPVLEGLARRTESILSVDTRRPSVARAALRAGAHLINDVEGLRRADLRREVARAEAGAVIMHMRGRPATMQADTRYVDMMGEIYAFLDARLRRAEASGIPRERLIVDPGIGFGKSLAGNLEILRRVGEFRGLGVPVLVGASRKSFLGTLLKGAPVGERLEASVAAAVVAALRGAHIVRVHDVAPTVKALRLADALRRP